VVAEEGAGGVAPGVVCGTGLVVPPLSVDEVPPDVQTGLFGPVIVEERRVVLPVAAVPEAPHQERLDAGMAERQPEEAFEPVGFGRLVPVAARLVVLSDLEGIRELPVLVEDADDLAVTQRLVLCEVTLQPRRLQVDTAVEQVLDVALVPLLVAAVVAGDGVVVVDRERRAAGTDVLGLLVPVGDDL